MLPRRVLSWSWNWRAVLVLSNFFHKCSSPLFFGLLLQQQGPQAIPCRSHVAIR